jgi:hypothetical protein
MYTLANDALLVSILDPVADRGRFGVRYCTGGYIFQIADAQVGDLLSGPTYPDSFNWYDGQGIPDAFHLSPLADPAAPDAVALVLGIGLCDLQAKEVRAFCDWQVEAQTASIAFRTTHRHATHAVELARTVTLVNRSVRSTTTVQNHGQGLLPIRWYPHPFYPQPASDELVKFNLPLAPIEDAAYRLAANRYVMRQGWPWQSGHFLALDHTPSANLVVLQRHPKLGLVAATCSYAPTFFPIWGNPYTFSWEPYLERSLGAGQTFTWWIDYEF